MLQEVAKWMLYLLEISFRTQVERAVAVFDPGFFPEWQCPTPTLNKVSCIEWNIRGEKWTTDSDSQKKVFKIYYDLQFLDPKFSTFWLVFFGYAMFYIFCVNYKIKFYSEV
jgi:hypothetical protein